VWLDVELEASAQQTPANTRPVITISKDDKSTIRPMITALTTGNDNNRDCNGDEYHHLGMIP